MTVTSGPPAAISKSTEVVGEPADMGGLAARAVAGDTAARDALLAHVAEAVGDRNGQVVAWHMVHPNRGRAQGVRCGGTDRGDAKAVRQRMAVG